MSYWYRSKHRGLAWSLLCSSIVFILCRLDYVYAIRKGRLMIPSLYTAMSGDLHIQLQYAEPYSTSLSDLSLEISRLSSNSNSDKEKLDTVKLYRDPRYNVTQITIACHNFIRGGIYELEVVNSVNRTTIEYQDERLRQQLDVRWPTPKLSVTPELIGTYPEEPVEVVLSFPEVECELKNMNVAGIPEFWLELSYCGQEVICNYSEDSSSPKINSTKSSATTTTGKSHVIYAEQVRGFPKTRLIKLRCELFGLAGHYMVQLKPVQPTPSFVSAATYIRADWNEKFVFNVHARSIFPCDPHTGIGVLFEYPACILDQADRVRLFAKLRADVASLKPPTSLHYVTEQRVIRGQHSLHFDCDFFSEKYVEYCFVYVSQAISGAVADIRMDCVPTLPVSDSDTGGWGPWSDWTPCSTTCTGGTRNRYRFCDSPPPRYGAKFCEGSAVETEHCGTQTADTWECLYGPGVFGPGKVSIERPEVSAEIGPGCRCGCIVHLGSPKPKRMIASSAQSCPGRSFWLIQADDGNRIEFKMDFFRLPCSTQYVKVRDGDSLASNLIAEYVGGSKISPDVIISTSSQVLVEFFSDELASIGGSCSGGFLAHALQMDPTKRNVTSITSRAITQKPQIGKRLTIVHIVAVIFASIIIIISALLGAQYMLRYRKYHLTESRGEVDSPIHTPRSSVGSLQAPDSPPSRAISTTTLLSEVIYLVKIRPRGRMKHSILRESIDAETLVKETGINDDTDRSKCDDTASIGSTHTLTNDTINDSGNNSNDKEIVSSSLNDTESITSRQDGISPTQQHQQQHLLQREQHHYLQLQQQPLNNIVDTPLPRRKVRLDKSKCSSDLPKRKLLDVKEDDTETDTESIKVLKKNNRYLSASSATLTNGMYSPAASIVSTATIRTTNQKESKEKQNREKLLARPDSEFSLANPEELELDYYDYNVVNAGAAPGSYLGMDPAYLVWIPPLDEGDIIIEVENEGKGSEPHYEEILPRYDQIDPGSNTETPEEDPIPKSPPTPPPANNSKKTSQDCENLKNAIIQKTLVAALLKDDSSKLNPVSSNKTSHDIPMTEFTDRSPARSYMRKNSSDTENEKETSVVKSPSDNLQDYYELDDIQFADDDDSAESDNSKSKTIKYNTNYRFKT